jgi:uncharacterized membrane protein required for colicin V production
MTPYDAAMAGVLIAGMFWGAWRGIVWQIASIASLILGYSVAHPLSGQLAPHFPGEPLVARALAMLTVYCVVAGGVFFTAWIIRATLRKLKFEAFDRHLGMVLGGLEGALLGMVATLFVVSLAPQTRDPIFASPTGKVVGQVMSALGPVLPDEARGVLAPFWSPTDAVAGVAQPAPGSESPFAATTVAPAPRDGATSAASLRDIIEEGETRLGRAIAAETAKGVEKATAGGANDGAVERR